MGALPSPTFVMIGEKNGEKSLPLFGSIGGAASPTIYP